jgi:hypothetical protein
LQTIDQIEGAEMQKKSARYCCKKNAIETNTTIAKEKKG